MRFEFATATRIVFGKGSFKDIGGIAAGFGKHAFVVVSRGGAEAGLLTQRLSEQNLASTIFMIDGEPKVSQVVEGVALARQAACDFTIGYGGGSPMDMAKAIAVMLRNAGDVFDYLEVIGRGKSISQPGAPTIAIPTTAGTGAEVTRNAVLASPVHKVKVSLRSPYMLPKVALVDSELTYSLPAPVTASTGMDALTQVIEPYVSSRSNPLADALCKDGIPRGARALVKAYENGNDPQAREEMALVSLFGGLALANAGLGAVHGFASVLGGEFNAPHGAICARLLAPVMDVNIRALKLRQSDSQVLTRYLEVSQWLTGSSQASLEDGIHWLYDLCAHLHIPGLLTYGLSNASISGIIEKSAAASSMKANPILLTNAELSEIIDKAL